MSYRYIPRAEFEHDLENILEELPLRAQPILESVVKAVVVRLVDGSICGQPLRGNLFDCMKFKVDLPAAQRHLYPASDTDPSPRWRVVYRIVATELRGGRTEDRLDVLAIGRRGDLSAYRIAAKRLRRGR